METEKFHTLEGTQLYFKPLEVSDVKAIHAYASDEQVKRYIGWRLMKTIQDTKEYVEEMIKREVAGTHLYASIVLKSTGAVIGTAMIFGFDQEAKHAELGYVFDKGHWGKGYATEAIAMMCGFVFETLKLHKLHARVVGCNIASSKVLMKNGFKLEGQFKDYYFIEGKYEDGCFYGKFGDN